jgi:fructokinase
MAHCFLPIIEIGVSNMITLITCMGECLIDFLPLQKGEATIEFRMHPAGSPLNVAVSVVRLGQRAAFACKIADDYFGRFLQSYITTEGIDTRFLTMAAGRSTLAFVAMEAGQPTFGFYREGAADTLLTVADVPDALLTETGILHIGSISLLSGTTPATVLATVERLKGQALLSLDPNLRPAMVQDEKAYRSLLQKLFSLIDILKLSDADLAWLMPNRPAAQAIHELLTLGPALVVVTRGAQGASAVKVGAAVVSVPGFPVEIVDTVGAGDTFCGALLALLAQRRVVTRASLQDISGEDLEEMLRFAAAAAALNCTRAGANPPRYIEVEQFLASHASS